MGWLTSYKLRLRRKRLKLRARRKARDLVGLTDRTAAIAPGDVLLFATLRNEADRLPYFLDYYRRLGVVQFLIVDNGSTDGSREFLREQEDVSLWSTASAYGGSRYGMDWLTYLLGRYGHGHWCVTVDVDEFLIYPFYDSRPLPALVQWLEVSNIRAMSAMQIDLYPKGPVEQAVCLPGQDPLTVAPWFDAGNYTFSRNPEMHNLWIQGGPRARAFFAQQPLRAPALNKIPLVKWHRRYAYASSTHMLLPRGLNQVYDRQGGETISGALLHAKFLGGFERRAALEEIRREHFASAAEYRAYRHGDPDVAGEDLDLWSRWSERFVNWRQLEGLGLISKGNWI